MIFDGGIFSFSARLLNPLLPLENAIYQKMLLNLIFYSEYVIDFNVFVQHAFCQKCYSENY